MSLFSCTFYPVLNATYTLLDCGDAWCIRKNQTRQGTNRNKFKFKSLKDYSHSSALLFFNSPPSLPWISTAKSSNLWLQTGKQQHCFTDFTLAIIFLQILFSPISVKQTKSKSWVNVQKAAASCNILLFFFFKSSNKRKQKQMLLVWWH